MWKSWLLKTSVFQAPSIMWNARHVRVHMTAMGSPKLQKGEKVKASLVEGMEFQSKNTVDKEGISKLDQRPSIIPSTGVPLQRLYLPFEEPGKGKKQSQITNPLDAKIALEGKAMEADHSGHEYGRVETLYNEAKDYEFSVPSGWDREKTADLLRFETQLKKSFSELNRLRTAYPKVSQIQGNLAEFWRSTSFPVKADFYRRNDLLKEWVHLADVLVPLLESVIQEYPKDIVEVASVSPAPEKGVFFDVVELLSRFSGDLIRNDANRSRVSLNSDTFKGKYVMICCFHVPVLPSKSSDFPFLISLCNELYSTRDDFEMVVVARMNSLADNEEVFHHFFSGFPESCLAVPFEASKTRDYICKVLDLDLVSHDFFECLLLNAEEITVGKLDATVFSRYGAEAFPFTEDVIYKRNLERKDMIFNKEGNWLERVLRCNDSSPDFVYKFNPTGGPRKEMSISKLGNKNKHVGLFLCTGGFRFSPELLAMHEKCRKEKIDFEVVVVCRPYAEMPFSIYTDPKVCQEEIDGVLKKHNIRDWWCLPFNNSVSVRFLHLTEFCYTASGFNCVDKLIVVGPDVNHLDVYGYNVMLEQGIEAFPFTVEGGIKARASKVKQITLESLFVDVDASVFVRGNNSSDSKNLAQLIRGKKNIIFCIKGERDIDFETLASMYNQTKAVEKEDFEMFLVVRPSMKEMPCEMPWYNCPLKALNSTNLQKLEDLLFGFGEDTRLNSRLENVLVGFGEDGRVCSLQRIYEVTNSSKGGSRQFSLGDTLRCDLKLFLGYDEFYNQGMEPFANPRVGRFCPYASDSSDDDR